MIIDRNPPSIFEVLPPPIPNRVAGAPSHRPARTMAQLIRALWSCVSTKELAQAFSRPAHDRQANRSRPRKANDCEQSMALVTIAVGGAQPMRTRASSIIMRRFLAGANSRRADWTKRTMQVLVPVRGRILERFFRYVRNGTTRPLASSNPISSTIPNPQSSWVATKKTASPAIM